MTAAGSTRTVLVVGGGGREHALAAAILDSQNCARLLVAPGNAGTPGERFDVAADDVDGLVALCRTEGVDLVVPGPEAALAAGLVDALAAIGIAAFGPTQDLARLESSKAHARDVAARLGIPSPGHANFGRGDTGAALHWFADFGRPVVVKQSGLAAGKGVTVPESDDETRRAIIDAIAVDDIVLEERLVGPECSLICLCSGTDVVAFPLAQDHKRIGEGDTGPNTGGMGAYAPAPVGHSTDELVATFVAPLLSSLAAAGTPYTGVIFAGIMLTAQGPRLLEYNCRFGDPEAQVLLPLLDADLLGVLDAAVTGTLGQYPVSFHDAHALGVVVAAEGYPASPRRGDAITALPGEADDRHLFHAGTELVDDELVTAGGRVLTCVGVGASLDIARDLAYEAVADVQFAGAQHRRDIGWRARAASITTYASAGVDIDEGARAVDLIKTSVAGTQDGRVLGGIGSFGGVLDVSFLKEFDHPVLVASTDGVGTKVELAARARRLRGVGVDIVNHCIDDVLVQRATPLFFLDYFAASVLEAADVADVVAGMADACAAAGCVLLGGETAEMPGVYRDGAFDIAGTLVGVAERGQLLPRPDIAEGDLLIGLASSGPHTNGYSYLRAALAWLPLDSVPAPLDRPLVDALLEPHRSYLHVLDPAFDTGAVKALMHITGGGLPENIPRALPPGLGAQVELGSWPVPPLFQLVQQVSALDAHELHRTLNMGIGMVLVVAAADAQLVRSAIDEPSWIIGRVVAGDGVELV
jgi:phosphoribosylamine--glycine ligase/phosphoribosylaminoimidazole synthetase